MSKLSRNLRLEAVTVPQRTFFVTWTTAKGSHHLWPDRNKYLLINVIRDRTAAGVFKVHDFVVMPEHVHLLISVAAGVNIGDAVGSIKKAFSRRVKQGSTISGAVWQNGFGPVPVRDSETFVKFRNYIARDPVRRGLVDSAEKYPFTFDFLARRKAAGAKALGQGAAAIGTTEVVPFHEPLGVLQNTDGGIPDKEAEK